MIGEEICGAPNCARVKGHPGPHRYFDGSGEQDAPAPVALTTDQVLVKLSYEMRVFARALYNKDGRAEARGVEGAIAMVEAMRYGLKS